MIDKSFFDSLDETLEKRKDDNEAFGNEQDWQPVEDGETLKGIFLKARYVNTKYGLRGIALVKDSTTNETMNVWLTRTVLRREVEDLKPAPGTPIGIRYEGLKSPEGGGSDYHLYTVVIPEQDEEQVIRGEKHWAEAHAKSTQRAAVPVENKQSDLKPF
jgi:hypothetical protein